MARFNWQLPNSPTLLALGTLALPISPYFCIAFYLGAGLVAAFRYQYKSVTTEVFLITCLFLIVSLWMILRTTYPWGWGIPYLNHPVSYPVTIFDYIIFFALFLSLRLKPFKNAEIKLIAWSFTLTSLPVFLIAFLERYGNWQENQSFYSYNYLHIFQIQIVPNSLRISAGFENPNLLGFYCVLVLSVALGLFLNEVRSKNWQAFSQKTNKPFNSAITQKIVAVSTISTCIVLLLLTLAWSGSRNAYLSFLLVMVSLTAYSKLKLLAIATLTTLLSLYISVSRLGWLTSTVRMIIPSVVWERISQISSQSHRLEIYKCAVELIREKPLIGWGIGNMPWTCEERLDYPPYGINHAHNIFLQLASELGIPVALLLSCLMAYVLFRSIHHILKYQSNNQVGKDLIFGFLLAAISGIIMNCFALAMFHSFGLTFLFCICLAIPYAATLKERKSGVSEPL